MPGKMARSAPRPSFGLPEALVAIHTSRLSCRKAGKARVFTLVWESSGESRLKGASSTTHGTWCAISSPGNASRNPMGTDCPF